jgi:hypothetical protein
MSYIAIEKKKINEKEMVKFCWETGVSPDSIRRTDGEFLIVDTRNKVAILDRLIAGDIIAETEEEFKSLVKLGLL